ncbi:preprotein translocase subunit SecY [Lachnospiraceae bacterium oral taxon 500]|nr:preprotein translocase subunit SecY [Lachnospiraceae bacterium oral taxon 500]
MLNTLKTAFKVEDVRKRIIYTLLMFVVIRLGANVPIPGINTAALQGVFASNEGLLSMLDAFSGGAFRNMTLFALGIIPYINSSIIMNLLTIAIPVLEEMQKEGEDGRKKIATITRYVTMVLALIQAIAITLTLNAQRMFIQWNFFSALVSVSAMVAGTAFLMWLGERMNEKGVGNGISLIIAINILSGLPSGVQMITNLFKEGRYLSIIAILVGFLAMIVVIVLIQLGERRISVQYAKRMQGRKVYGGQSTYIPLKVNMAGVIPVIFASSLLGFPQVLAGFFTAQPTGVLATVLNFLNYYTNPFGTLLYFILTVAFAYFYTAIIFNPYEVADNMKKNGGFIPGIRPGKPTMEYLTTILNRMVFIGGVILGLISILPIILRWTTQAQINFGGTSLIIVVGVALETINQIESLLITRHYKGFLNV